MRLEYKNSRIAAEIDICIYSIEPLTNVFKFETLKLSLICITATLMALLNILLLQISITHNCHAELTLLKMILLIS